MRNPNKIHSIEKLVTIKTHPINEKPVQTTREISIKQIQPGNKVSELYKFTMLPSTETTGRNKKRYQVQVLNENKIKKTTTTFREHYIDRYIQHLIDQYEMGYVLFNYSMLPADGAYHYKLTYKQTKFMLNFERKSNRFPKEQHDAIKHANPTLIGNYTYYDKLDCGEYVIHSLSRGLFMNNYSCTTFNPKIAEWIENVINEY